MTFHHPEVVGAQLLTAVKPHPQFPRPHQGQPLSQIVMGSRQLIGHAVHRPTNAVPAKEIVMLIAIVLVVSFAEPTTAKLPV